MRQPSFFWPARALAVRAGCMGNRVRGWLEMTGLDTKHELADVGWTRWGPPCSTNFAVVLVSWIDSLHQNNGSSPLSRHRIAHRLDTFNRQPKTQASVKGSWSDSLDTFRPHVLHVADSLSSVINIAADGCIRKFEKLLFILRSVRLGSVRPSFLVHHVPADDTIVRGTRKVQTRNITCFQRLRQDTTCWRSG